MIDELKNSAYKLVTEVQKGWSADKKYYIETKYNQKLLMRISHIKFYENKMQEFEMIKKVFALDIPMSQPLDFGNSKDGIHVYTLLSWIDDNDLEIALLNLKTEEQYTLGYEAGILLRKYI